MASDRAIMRGLNTDLPPDRVEDQAIRIKNLLPVSAVSLKPRPGTSLVSFYQVGNLGNNIVVDGLLDSENGRLLSIVNTRLVDGQLMYRVEHLDTIFWSRVPEDVTIPGNVYTDNTLPNYFFGSDGATTYLPIYSNFLTGASTNFVDTTQSGIAQSPSAIFYLPPGTYISQGTPDVEYEAARGFLVFVYLGQSGTPTVYAELFDLETGDNVLKEAGRASYRITQFTAAGLSASPRYSIYSGGLTLRNPYVGWIQWHPTVINEAISMNKASFTVVGASGADFSTDSVTQEIPVPDSYAAISGTVEVIGLTNTVNGTDTLFTQELVVGNIIFINGQANTVATIVGDTQLVMNDNWSSGATGETCLRYVIGGVLTSMAPLYNSDLYYIAGYGNTQIDTPQIRVVRIVPPSGNTPPATWTNYYAYKRKYDTGSSSLWTDRPNTCLAVQAFPTTGVNKSTGVPTGSIAALFGNWVATPSIHMAVTRPRFALLTGPVQSTFGDPTPIGCDIINTHADTASYRAHGMCVDSQGYVYMTGTGDFITNEANWLILKYAPWDLTTPIARVAHNSNGLGDGYVDPLDTHIIKPTWTGSRLLVEDHDASQTRIFVYDKDLNYIGKYQVSNASLTYGSRTRMSNASTPFIARAY